MVFCVGLFLSKFISKIRLERKLERNGMERNGFCLENGAAKSVQLVWQCERSQPVASWLAPGTAQTNEDLIVVLAAWGLVSKAGQEQEQVSGMYLLRVTGQGWDCSPASWDGRGGVPGRDRGRNPPTPLGQLPGVRSAL